LKRGRGSQSKTKVLVMAESEFVDNLQKGRKPKRVNHIKMQVISNLKSNTITNIVKEQVDKSAELIRDNSTSYIKLKERVQSHEAKVVEAKMIPVLLPWVHIAINNAKRLFLDVHHNLQKKYLQHYLNEFCYKFNKRYFALQRSQFILLTRDNYVML